MHCLNLAAISLLILSMVSCQQKETTSLTIPSDLTCEFQSGENIVCDKESPRLSWINKEAQTAYQIIVSSTFSKLSMDEGDIWDSGKVVSEESVLVPYAGPQLPTMQDCWWKVRIWNDKDEVSGWSESARWNTGMMQEGDWTAQWIGAPWQVDEKGTWYGNAPVLRKEIDVKKKGLVSARAYISGLGWFKMSLNGERVWNDRFVPGLTDYTLRPYLETNPRIPLDPRVTAYRTLYMGYDIKKQLSEGKNTIDVLLGNGYFHSSPNNEYKNENYGVPRMICQIVLRYEDGQTETFCSDTTWQAAKSQIISNDLYSGEFLDGSKVVDGWEPAQVKKAPDGKLTANMAPSDKVIEKLDPVSFEKLEDGTYKVDFGKEISGWIRFHDVKGNAGDTLKVNFVCESVQGNFQYIFSGNGKESFSPEFTWYVFREAIISGVSSLKAENLIAEAVNTDVRLNSRFECSNPLFEQIIQIWQRSQMDNMHAGVASDCPHREKLPYTGDGQISMPMVLANFDASAFYNKWIDDVRGSQNPETGYVPNGAPWEPWCGGGPAWGSSICVMPWEFYLRYGDRSILERCYDGMKDFVRFYRTWVQKDGTAWMKMTKPDGSECYWYNLGDWAPAYQVPEDALVHTFFLWLCERNTSLTAKALGNEAEAQEYAALAEATKTAFSKRFYDTDTKSYGDFGSNVYALYMGVPDEQLEDVRATLREELGVKYNKHVNVGFIAHRFIYEALSMNGMGDLAYDILNQRDFPSFGWWIEQGATTTWEQWKGTDSRNHPMFGGGLAWFSRYLAGVNPDPAEPGFKHIIVRPVPVEALENVTYTTKTPYGELISHVAVKDGAVKMDVTVPFGSHATVYVPKSMEAVTAAPMDDDSYEIHEVGPGSHSF